MFGATSRSVPPADRTQPSTTPPPAGRRRVRVVAALSASAVLALGSLAATAPANAATTDDNPIGGLVKHVTKDVTKTLDHTVKGVTSSTSKAPARSRSGSSGHSSSGSSHSSGSSRIPVLSSLVPSTTRSGSSSGSGSTAATPKNHAGGSVAQAGLGKGAPLVGLSSTGTSASRNQSTADAKLLSIAGYTVIGSQAGSPGSGTGTSGIPQVPLCAATGGAICLDLLYADSAADASGSTASTGVAGLCVGGHDQTGATCDGVEVGVAPSESETRGTKSSSTSALLDVCAKDNGSCLLDLSALGSSSSAGSGAGSQKPTLVDVVAGDLHLAGPDDQADTDVTKDCTVEVLCATLNDKTTQPGSDDSGSALDLTGLGGNLDGGLGSSDAGSSTPKATTPTEPTTGSGKQGGTARSTLADIGAGLGGTTQQLVGVSQNTSSGDLDSTHADAQLLTILGHDVIASHADSNGEGHGPVPDNPLCASSGGALCIDPLYADSSATKSSTGSAASTRTGVADLCVGGHDPSGATCDGLEVGLGQGSSSVVNNGTTGVTRTTASSALADVCLHGDTGCTVDGDVLKSEGSADSTGTKSQSSSIADAGLGGTGAGAPSNPIEVSVPADCPATDVACVLLNQVDNGAQGGGTSAGTTVVGVTGVGDTVGVTGAQTGVTANGGNPAVDPPVVDPPVVDPPSTGTPTTTTRGTTPQGSAAMGVTASSEAAGAATGTTGGLPNTGGVALGVLGLGLLLLGAGAAFLAAHRRRTIA